jgi:hypothetical protein
MVAAECFCGCGRRIPKFPLGMRSINARGKQVSDRLGLVDGDHPHLKRENELIAAWCEQGQNIRTELVAAMHGEVDARSLEERPIRDWQAEGRRIERYINQQYARLGRWARESGLSEQEVLEAIRRGEYQPPSG